MIKRSNASKLCVIFGAETEIDKRYRASVSDALILFYEIGEIFEAVTQACRNNKIKTDAEVAYIADLVFSVIDENSYRIVEIPCGVHRMKIVQNIAEYSKIKADGENV